VWGEGGGGVGGACWGMPKGGGRSRREVGAECSGGQMGMSIGSGCKYVGC